MAMKLWKLGERMGGAGAIGVINKEEELLKGEGQGRLLDKDGKILQVMWIASFCQ